MALQSVTRIETAELAFGSLTASSTHDIGTVPDNCVILAAGAECTSAATIGGANAVSFGVTGGDTDMLGTADINGAKTLGASTTTVNGITNVTTASTTFTALTAGSNAPSAGSFKFFVVYAPMGATGAADEVDRDLLA